MSGPRPAAGARPGYAPRARTGGAGLFRGLRVHLALLVGALFLVFYLVTAALIYGLTAQVTQSDVDAILDSQTRPLAAQVLHDLDRGVFPSRFVAVAQLTQAYPRVSAIVLRDAQGNVIASTAPRVTRSLAYQGASAAGTLATDDVAGYGSYRVLTLRLENPYRQTVGYLQMAMSVNRDQSALGRLLEVLLLVGGVGIALAAAAGFYLSRLSLRPAIRAWDQQEQFVADASHELRTPLAVMRVNLELVLSRPDATVQDNRTWLETLAGEIGRLTALTDQMLALARSAPGRPARRQPVDLAELAGQTVEAFRAAAQGKGLALAGPPDRPEGGVKVQGDPEALHRLVAILLDNAVKYTQEGRIEVLVERQRRTARLRVRDTGIGIAPEHLGRVFDRFYRADAARAKDSGGAGLGLAIARSIARAHGGDIAIESAVGQGTEVSVTLPL